MAENDRETVETLIEGLISTMEQGRIWTERRDIAEFLAETAKRMVTAIENVVKSEDDPDVQTGCQQALNRVREHLKLAPIQVQAAPEPAPVAVEPQQPALEPDTQEEAEESQLLLSEIVSSYIEGPGVTASETDDGYEIVIRLESGRFQKVYLAEGRDEKKGVGLIHIFTAGGPADSRVFKWALEANSKLTHGAIGIRSLGGKEMLVISDTYVASTVRREQVRDAVFAIAETGDVIEKGLTRVDTL